MTRKEYVLISKVIRGLPISGPERLVVVQNFTMALVGENPRFNPEKFRDACIPKEESK